MRATLPAVRFLAHADTWEAYPAGLKRQRARSVRHGEDAERAPALGKSLAPATWPPIFEAVPGTH